MKKRIAMALAAALCFAMLAGGVSCAEGIQLADYLGVEFSGVDGEGTARCVFDYLGFEGAVAAGGDLGASDLSAALRVESALVISVSPESGLKNGDAVTATVALDPEVLGNAAIPVSGGSRTFAVEGLRADGTDSATVELDAFDPAFWDTADGISIQYTGRSPYGFLEVTNSLPDDNPLSRVGYTLSEQQNVHEGDSVSVTPYFTVHGMEKEYCFKAPSSTYTVGAVDHYLTDIQELDDDTVASLKLAAQARAEEGAAGMLEFQEGSDYRGFYNSEAVTVESIQPGDSAYTVRNSDGFIQSILIPCYLEVTVQEPDWMENAQAYAYDLVFLCTVNDIIVYADGSVSTGVVELTRKGTTDTEALLMEDLKTWYTDPVIESVAFPAGPEVP